MSRLLSVIGILITSLYLLTLFLLFKERSTEISSLSPNNLGDFLAGAFGPLAVFWLILGFFQQGIELRQNTESLKLQAQELKNSVEQQRQLVEVSRQQVNAEIERIKYEHENQRKAAQPKFIFDHFSTNKTIGYIQSSLSMRNVRNAATQIKLIFSDEVVKFHPERISALSLDDIQNINWHSLNLDENISLTVAYIDALGNLGEQRFQFSSKSNNLIPIET